MICVTDRRKFSSRWPLGGRSDSSRVGLQHHAVNSTISAGDACVVYLGSATAFIVDLLLRRSALLLRLLPTCMRESP